MTLQVVLAVYLVFTYLGGKSNIKISTPPSIEPQITEDTNEVGRVGAIGFGMVQKARFVNFNEDNQVCREFGFEKLLHKTGDQWGITEPFMNLYQQDFECTVTALNGMIIANDLAGTTDIKEATLKNNVVINIIPKNQIETGQIDIYLNDIVFISDRSLFLTAGPVKILAKDMQLLGRGLEIVYNYAEDRLEFFRIIDLESLCLNRIHSSNFSESSKGSPADTSQNRSKQDGLSLDKYQAVLSANVDVRSQGKALIADEKLVIQNIIRKKDVSEDTPETVVSGPNDVLRQPISDLFDIVATCDEGLVILPMGSSSEQTSLLSSVRKKSLTGQNSSAHDKAEDVNSLKVKSVYYDASDRHATATGPVNLIYHTKGQDEDSNDAIVTITAEDRLTFLPDSRNVVFEGNCICVYSQDNYIKPRKYTLTAPKITAVLAEESLSGNAPTYVQHILAEGGVEVIVHDTITGEQIAQFDTPRLDYVADGGDIVASGPSELRIWQTSTGKSNNSRPVKITASQKVYFEPAFNTIFFEGDCFCETIQNHSTQDRKYTLAAQYIAVEMFSENNKTSSLQIAGLKKVIARDNAIVTSSTPASQTKIAEFTANEITYDSVNDNVLATGPSRLLLFATNPEQPYSDTETPVAITSQNSTLFSLVSNQAIFRGQCVCTMIRTDTGTARKYTLSAPEVSIDIASSTDSVFSSSGIDYLTAGDNAVIVVTPLSSVAEMARFSASRIKYSAISESIIADGPCDFIFYANDFIPSQAIGDAVPVQINAKQSTTFLPVQNKLIFEGDCICNMVRSKTDTQNNYTLSAPKITLDLSRQQQSYSAASVLSIEKFTADGGIVQISNVNTISNSLTGFNKIKCHRFIYDTIEKVFTSVGPGVITVDNSNVEDTSSDTNGLSITKRCYAFLRDFATLDYDLKTNRIIARNTQNKILADYFPVVEGTEQNQIKASAGAIEIQLLSNNNGKNEIFSLKAFKGITYEDSENEFIAAQMFYEAETSIVKAYGSNFHRCYLNGAIVDNIIYDLKNRAVINVDITDPARVQALKQLE